MSSICKKLWFNTKCGQYVSENWMNERRKFNERNISAWNTFVNFKWNEKSFKLSDTNKLQFRWGKKHDHFKTRVNKINKKWPHKWQKKTIMSSYFQWKTDIKTLSQLIRSAVFSCFKFASEWSDKINWVAIEENTVSLKFKFISHISYGIFCTFF